MSRRRDKVATYAIDPTDPDFNAKVAEAISLLGGVGIRGKRGEDEARPSLREVRELLRKGRTSNGFSSTGGLSGGDSSAPSIPTGVSTLTSPGLIVIRWDMPTYGGHVRSEIYRSTTGLIGDASSIGTTSSNQYTDYDVGNELTFTYFVRHQSDSLNSLFSDGAEETSLEPFYADGKVSNKNIDISDAVSGVLDNTTTVDHVFELTDSDSPKVIFSVSGVFESEEVWDGIELLPEDGNAVSVSILRDATGIATIAPVRTQVTYSDTNGQNKYLHILTYHFIDSPPVGEITYHISANRLFSSNTDAFEVSYQITAIRS
jgi:hypothetical protein